MTFTGKILVADDEAHIRKFVSLVLKSIAQPTLVEASNGRQAIELFRSEQPDLVLLDVNMPELDGVQALEEIRKADPDALVVMLTSLANRQTVEDCVRLGAIDYIRKDTPRQEMIEQFQRILRDCFQN